MTNTLTERVPSPALALIDLIVQKGDTSSYVRINASRHGALSLAVSSGLRFDPDDLAYIHAGRYGMEYWIGDGEWIYFEAISASNMSACHAFEQWRGRRPFMANNVQIAGATRKRERLAVGLGFTWEDQGVWVTSFSEDQSRLVACSYRRQEPNKERKILHRYNISHEDLKDRARA